MDRTWLDRTAAQLAVWGSGAGTGPTVENIPSDYLVRVSQFGALLNLTYRKCFNGAFSSNAQ